MIFVENCNSPVFCPDCGERMSKISFPRESFPSTLKNGTIVRKYLGLAHCSTPKCETDLLDWVLGASALTLDPRS